MESNRRTAGREALLLLAVFVGCIGVFFYRVFAGDVIYCCDNFLINVPAKVYWARMIHQGIFPLWNPYILSGVPFLADINLAALYPFNGLYLFLSPFGALTANILVHVLLALVGMFILGRSFGFSKIAATGAALVFGFSGTLIVYTNNVPMLQVAALIPWVVWSWRRFWQGPSLVRLVPFILFASAQIMAGHAQLAYLTWVWLLSYLLFLVRAPWRSMGLWLSMAVGGVFLVSAIQILPFLEFVLQSTRTGRGFAYATFGSMSPFAFVRLVLPSIVGDLRQGTAWLSGGSVYGYVGTLSIVIAVINRQRSREIRFLWLVVIVSLLLALGSFTPFFGLAYVVLPGLGLFRSPEHFLLLYTFSLALLVGFGLGDLGGTKTIIISTRWLRRIGGVAIGLGILVWLWSRQLLAAAGQIPGIGNQLQRKLSTLPIGALPQVVGAVSLNLLVIGLVWIACSLLIQTLRKHPWQRALCVGFTCIELFLFSRYPLVTAPMETVSRWLAQARMTAELVGHNDKNMERIWTDTKAYPAPFPKRLGQSDWVGETAWQAQILRPNINMLFSLATIDGYSALVPGAYQQFLGGLSADPTGVSIGQSSMRRFALLGVDSIIEASHAAISVTGQPAALPRVFLLDFRGKRIDKLQVQSFLPNSVDMVTNASAASRLVFADAIYPGWQVLVDGNQASLDTYEGYLKSIQVPPGEHRVRFSYEPLSVMMGLWLSVSGIFACVVIVLNGMRGKR